MPMSLNSRTPPFSGHYGPSRDCHFLWSIRNGLGRESYCQVAGSAMSFPLCFNNCLSRFLIQTPFTLEIAHLLEHLSQIIDIASDVRMGGPINRLIDGQRFLAIAFG